MKNVLKLISVVLLLAITVSAFSVMAFAEEGADVPAGGSDNTGDTTLPELPETPADPESKPDEGEVEEEKVYPPGPGGRAYDIPEDIQKKVDEHVDLLNSFGYNLPYEGDMTVPKYVIIDADGTETVRYDALMLKEDADAMKSGSTLKLLSDLYLSTTYKSALSALQITTRYLAVVADYQKTINFDFAGHTIFTEYKVGFFSCKGSAELNIYSSKPGARLINIEQGKTSGGSVITVNSGVARMGATDKYPGTNISTYSAGGYSVAGSGTLYVKGVDAYRAATDYVGYFTMSGSGGTANFEDFRAFGVHRYLQIAHREDGNNLYTVVGTTMNFKNCVLANIGAQGVVTGAFFRYIADDNVINFESTVFDNVSLSSQRYYEHEGLVDIDGNKILPCETARITFDKYCSYSILPDVKSYQDNQGLSSINDMFIFPELVEGYGSKTYDGPKFILRNGKVDEVACFMLNNFEENPNGYNDFTMIPANEDVSGMFCLPYLGYETEVREVTWSFKGASYSENELWIKGYDPIPYRINVPEDTPYIQYIIEEIYADEEIAYYSISPKVDLTFKANFTFHDQIYINVYVPVYEDFPVNEMVYRMNVAGVAVKLNQIRDESEVVSVDGQDYYKVVVAVPYERITDSFYINVDIPNSSGTASSFSVSKKIEFHSLMRSYLEGDYDDDFKQGIGDVLYLIYKKATNAAVVPSISALVSEKFADRIAADKAAAEEALKREEEKNKSFFDKLLEAIGLK